MTLLLLAVVVLGLMCGSELNVGAFGHPILHRQPIETHIRVRSSLAALFWPHHAILDGALHRSQSSVTDAVYSLESVGVASGRARAGDSNWRGGFLAGRSGAHQHPHRTLDARSLTQRLEGTGASLGPIPLASDLLPDCGVHHSGVESGRLLTASARPAAKGAAVIHRRHGEDDGRPWDHGARLKSVQRTALPPAVYFKFRHVKSLERSGVDCV